MALTIAEVARDYETDGVPSSGPHKIKKNNLRGWGAWVESIISAFTTNGGLIYPSKAILDADLAHDANTMAWVLGDATVANNGVYRKIGTSGDGSWTRFSDLPFSFIIASDVGAGTANAIQATTSIPVSGSALIWMNIFEANTASPVTVSFNGGAALTVKTNSGGNVAVGGLVSGMIVLGIVSGTTFRLVSDQASAAVVAAAEAAADRAEAAAAAAQAAAAEAAITPINLGAVGDGVANDQLAFDQLEAIRPGAIIDLGNRTYRVTTVPKNCRYWNGRFYDGTTYYDQAWKPFLDPMDGQNTLVMSSEFVASHPSLCYYDEETDELYYGETCGRGHIGERGQILNIWKSKDGGDSWNVLGTFLADDDAENRRLRSVNLGKMANGRIGGLITTGSGGVPPRKKWFFYTDDKFATSHLVELVGLANQDFIHGELMPWPASAGGHDTLGFQVFSYVVNVGLSVTRTANNGTTWTREAIPNTGPLPAGATWMSEPTVVQTDDGWLMFCRAEPSGANMGIRKSADGTAWGDWIDSGIKLGGNVCHAIRDGGNVNLYLIYREGFQGDDTDNSIVLHQVEQHDAYADPLIFAKTLPRRIFAMPYTPTGYPKSFKSSRGWYHFLRVSEERHTSDGSATSVAMIRQSPGAMKGNSLQETRKQVLRNNTFRFWPRGVSITSASNAGGVGRFRMVPSGATMTMERAVIPLYAGSPNPFRSQYGIRITSTGSNDFAGFNQEWYGQDAREMAEMLSDRKYMVVRIYGWGAFPSAFQAGLSINGVSAGNAFFTPPQNITGGEAPWVAEALISDIASLATLGIDITAVTTVAVVFSNGPVASEYIIRLAGIGAFIGPAPYDLPQADYLDDLRWVERYCENTGLTASDPVGMGVASNATTIHAHLQFRTPKPVDPTMSVSAAADFAARGTAVLTPSAFVFATANEYSARMTLTVAGAVGGQAQLIEVAASPPGTPFIRADTGC